MTAPATRFSTTLDRWRCGFLGRRPTEAFHLTGLRGRPTCSSKVFRQPVAYPGTRCLLTSTIKRRSGRQWRVHSTDVEADLEDRKSRLKESLQALIPEVTALDFPLNEIRSYFEKAQKPPKQFHGFNMSRTVPVVEELMRGSDAGDIDDVDAMEVVQIHLTNLWKWRRRGGGAYDGELAVHEAALQDLQNISPEDSEKITSVLLDDMPISEEDKAQLSGAVRQVAVAGVQSILWNAIGLAIIFLIVLNFAGRG